MDSSYSHPSPAVAAQELPAHFLDDCSCSYGAYTRDRGPPGCGLVYDQTQSLYPSPACRSSADTDRILV